MRFHVDGELTSSTPCQARRVIPVGASSPAMSMVMRENRIAKVDRSLPKRKRSNRTETNRQRDNVSSLILPRMPFASAIFYFWHVSRTVQNGPQRPLRQYGSPCESAFASRTTFALQQRVMTSPSQSIMVHCRSKYLPPWRTLLLSWRTSQATYSVHVSAHAQRFRK